MDDLVARYAYSCGHSSFLREFRCPGCGQGIRIERHADHEPSLVCRPAGFGLCEVLPLSADRQPVIRRPVSLTDKKVT